MQEYRINTNGLRGRFAKLHEGQVISDDNLSLAGHDVAALVADGKIEPANGEPETAPPDAGSTPKVEAYDTVTQHVKPSASKKAGKKK